MFFFFSVYFLKYSVTETEIEFVLDLFKQISIKVISVYNIHDISSCFNKDDNNFNATADKSKSVQY